MSIAMMTNYKPMTPPRSLGHFHGSMYLLSPRSSSPPSPSLADLLRQMPFPSPPASQPAFFSPVNKISVISLERRIDYHLQRIMKQNRLINFKNSIEALPIKDRISESLLEIIASSNNLILRRQNLVLLGSQLLSQLRKHYEAGNYEDAFNLMVTSFGNLKHISSSLGQLMWALNSNKEHVKYVIKVFALPDVYTRPGPDEDSIPLKERIVQMVELCEETIEKCQTLKDNIHNIMVPVFMARFNHGE